MIYFYYVNPTFQPPAIPKAKTKKIRCAHAQIFFYGEQPIRNAAETYIFFADFWLGKNMENDVNSDEILCFKISEIREKVFYNRGFGG